MNPPQVYMCSPSWTLLPPPSPYHPSGSSQCTSPKHPVLCIQPGLATRFIHDILHVSMPFSQTLCTRRQKRHWCIEQSYGLCGRGRGYWVLDNLLKPKSRLPLCEKERDFCLVLTVWGWRAGSLQTESKSRWHLVRAWGCLSHWMFEDFSKAHFLQELSSMSEGRSRLPFPTATAVSSKQSQEGFMKGSWERKPHYGPKILHDQSKSLSVSFSRVCFRKHMNTWLWGWEGKDFKNQWEKGDVLDSQLSTRASVIASLCFSFPLLYLKKHIVSDC